MFGAEGHTFFVTTMLVEFARAFPCGLLGGVGRPAMKIGGQVTPDTGKDPPCVIRLHG